MSVEQPGRHPEVKAIQQTRRLLANARERTRVHTISAAFEALRKQVIVETCLEDQKVFHLFLS